MDLNYIGNNEYSNIESCQFEYEYGARRFFLSKLLHSKQGVYNFNYNGAISLPEPGTKDLDHWRFWKVNAMNTTLIPSFNLSRKSQDVQYTNNTREPSGSNYDYGLLCSILYPTGGMVEFDYEPHTYSSQIVQNASTGYIKSLTKVYMAPEIAGGARIRRVSYYTDNKIIPIKQVEYQYKDTMNSHKSSGILMYSPRYVHKEFMEGPGFAYDLWLIND